jgi:hypothetical protein
MVSYPQGKVVGTIPWYTLGGDICSDPNSGNVFIPEGTGSNSSYVYEYAHGMTTPMATLNLPSGYTEPIGCAVDPTTGNLAVTVNYNPSHYGALLVYPGAQGSPNIYQESKLRDFSPPAYDGSENLYATSFDKDGGIRLAEIPAGQSAFTLIRFSNCNCVPATMQWDGTYMDFEDSGSTGLGLDINQLSINGSTATLVNSILLDDGTANNGRGFCLYDGLVFAKLKKVLKGNNQGVGVWPFPSGGNPTKKIYGLTQGRRDGMNQLTVSVAPSH